MTEEVFQHYNSKSPQGCGNMPATAGDGGVRVSGAAIQRSQSSRRNSADQR